MPRKSGWVSVGAGDKCLVCSKTDWCGHTEDYSVLVCHRCDHDVGGYTKSPKPTKAGGSLYFRGSPEDSLRYDPFLYQPPARKPEPEPDPEPPRDFTAEIGHRLPDHEARMDALAVELGIEEWALAAVGFGWNGSAYTVPATDPAGVVTGVQLRYPGGKKRSVPGSRFTDATFTADGWHEGIAELYICEGATDTAALVEIGCSAIGRYTARGGISAIAELLGGWPVDRPIVVLAERDEKDDGSWPGKEAAIQVADGLSRLLFRDVRWCFPPGVAKDAREAVAGGATSLDFRHAAASGEVIRGALPRPHEDGTVDASEPRDLGEYRKELASNTIAAVKDRGVCVSRAPTGAGKSYAAVHAIHESGLDLVWRKRTKDGQQIERQEIEPTRSVTVMPSHDNLAERLEEMLEGGHWPSDVAAMPKLSEDNCENFAEAAAARTAGLSHGAAVCVGCSCRPGCKYVRQAEAARKARHLLTTAEHYRRSFNARYMKERSLVIIDERCDEVLAPAIECTPEEMLAAGQFFDSVASVALSIGVSDANSWSPDAEERCRVAADLSLVASELAAAAVGLAEAANSQTEEGALRFAVDPTRDLPFGWERMVFGALKDNAVKPPPPAAMRALLAVASAEAKTWAIADFKDGKPNAELQRKIIVSWRLPMERKRLLLMDGTADLGELADLCEADTREITPEGRLALVHPITQRAEEIFKSTSPARVRALLIGLLEEMPQYTRIGIVGHKRHVKALLGDPEAPEALPDIYRQRFAKISHFGAGSDRGSNDWHTTCDLLLVLGTPRPNPASVRRRMAILGIREATGPRGQFGLLTWTATLKGGGTAEVETSGYAEPAWQRFYVAITRAAIRQAVGRARSTLKEGIPTVVVTKEPLGYEVVLDPISERSGGAQRILEEMHVFAGEIEQKDPRWKLRTLSQKLYEIHMHRDRKTMSWSLRSIYERLGAAPHSIRNGLAELVAEGAVHRTARSWYALGPQPTVPGPVDHYCLHDDTAVLPLTAAPAHEVATAALLDLARARPANGVTLSELRSAINGEDDAIADAQRRRTNRGVKRLTEDGTLIPVSFEPDKFLVNHDAAGTRCYASEDRKRAEVLIPPGVAGEVTGGGALLVTVSMVKGEVVVEQRKA